MATREDAPTISVVTTMEMQMATVRQMETELKQKLKKMETF